MICKFVNIYFIKISPIEANMSKSQYDLVAFSSVNYFALSIK